jgi:ribosomal protein L29
LKLRDIEKVNHLVAELAELRTRAAMAEQAEPALYQLFIEAPGDASLRMSKEGASSPHSGGVTVSDGFLARLKQLAEAELKEQVESVLASLAALGVDTSGD